MEDQIMEINEEETPYLDEETTATNNNNLLLDLENDTNTHDSVLELNQIIFNPNDSLPTSSNNVSRKRSYQNIEDNNGSEKFVDKILLKDIPAPGTRVSPGMEKRAGPYILGPLIGTSPVQSIVQCLARKEATRKYYTIKILTLKENPKFETQDDRQGKMLLHAEYSLLSLLHNQDGVVHHHGFFKVIIMMNI